MNKRQLFAILLGIVFLQYFAASNFFIHSHKLPTRIIVHSHPFPDKPHNHTDNQIDCLDLLSEATCVTTQQVNAPDFVADIIRTIGGAWIVADGQRPDVGIMSLRAPPTC
ncbi:MAG: hypothetical protein J5526_02265 [Bacteroidales bacterium]|nr:hypothetical protein [Bacteroidales bacterium]